MVSTYFFIFLAKILLVLISKTQKAFKNHTSICKCQKNLKFVVEAMKFIEINNGSCEVYASL